MTERSADTRATRWLCAPKDAAALAVFRVAFGAMVTLSAARVLYFGWAELLFARPTFHFKYWGFEWVPHLPSPFIELLFATVGVLGILVSVGLFYRPAIVALFVAHAWVQLIDVSTYLNHYYLVTLLALLLCFVPAHRLWSIDAWRRPQLASQVLPAWCTYLLRFQVAVVYLFAGLAKLTGDWLLHAQPLRIWLTARTGLPVVGPYLDERWVAFAAAWSGFLFDSTIVLFLLHHRTRPFAYVAVIGFHAATSALFPIGMFPVIMILAASVFFDADWPRRISAKLSRLRADVDAPPRPVAPLPLSRLNRVGIALATVYCVVQVALPVRAYLYGGNHLWHEQGMRWSWRVMSREKNGSVLFIVTDPRTGRERHVPPSRYVDRLQERELSVQPDLILQLAQRIAAEMREKLGGPVEVRVEAWVSLNGRPAALLIDPAVDLAREVDGLSPKRWILSAPTSAPPSLERVVAYGQPTYAK